MSGSRKAHTISICPFLITKSREREKKYRLLTVRLPRNRCGEISFRPSAEFDDGIERLQAISDSLDTAPEYNLPEPSGLMTAKTYKTKVRRAAYQEVKIAY